MIYANLPQILLSIIVRVGGYSKLLLEPMLGFWISALHHSTGDRYFRQET